jgi:hypothetical protein
LVSVGSQAHLLAGEGVGGPNADEGTDTLVLFVYYNLSTPAIYFATAIRS